MEQFGIPVDATFAEAFDMKATRLIITGETLRWARQAANAMCGFATSVIGCGAEAGIERELTTAETPDERPGISVLLFCMSSSQLAEQVFKRVGQCVLTCPSSSVFAGLHSDRKIPLGSRLRYFGDGYQISKVIGDTRYWRIPVMDGEFVCEEFAYQTPAIGGGNFLILARDLQGALSASEAAVAAIRTIPNVVVPFPGGVARSGSKVGSKYAALSASTNDEFCPTLLPFGNTNLDNHTSAALELVIDGLDFESIATATRIGIEAACKIGTAQGVTRITAGNYGGKLGRHHFHLREILTCESEQDHQADATNCE